MENNPGQIPAPRAEEKKRRGRPPLPRSKKPKHRIDVHVTQDELRAIDAHRANHRRMSRAGYLRQGGVQGWLRRTNIALEIDRSLINLQRLLDQLRGANADPAMIESLSKGIHHLDSARRDL